MTLRIEEVGLEVQREPFARPFAFKGACFHEKWNAVVRLVDADARVAFGVGGFAALWAHAAVFIAHTETGGNALMLSVLERALQEVKGREFADPLALHDAVVPLVHDYGKYVTRNPNLKLTFTLNALVALDNAAWVLHARANNITSFDGLIPVQYRGFLAEHHTRVAATPLVNYTLRQEEVRRMAQDGYYFLKIKIGQGGPEDQMIRKDMARLTEIHEAVCGYRTPMTRSGRILYYLDANGRYKSKESIMTLLRHAERIAALDRIALVEELFQEELRLDVRDLPVRVAADESIHTLKDLRERVDQGYGAIAIKPAGKSLSVALRMVAEALKLDVPCYVADNACVPVLVDWNKNVAARLPAFPGLGCGILESNGPATYATWDKMLGEHPCAGAQ